MNYKYFLPTILCLLLPAYAQTMWYYPGIVWQGNDASDNNPGLSYKAVEKTCKLLAEKRYIPSHFTILASIAYTFITDFLVTEGYNDTILDECQQNSYQGSARRHILIKYVTKALKNFYNSRLEEPVHPKDLIVLRHVILQATLEALKSHRLISPLTYLFIKECIGIENITSKIYFNHLKYFTSVLLEGSANAEMVAILVGTIERVWPRRINPAEWEKFIRAASNEDPYFRTLHISAIKQKLDPYNTTEELLATNSLKKVDILRILIDTKKRIFNLTTLFKAINSSIDTPAPVQISSPPIFQAGPKKQVFQTPLNSDHVFIFEMD